MEFCSFRLKQFVTPSNRITSNLPFSIRILLLKIDLMPLLAHIVINLFYNVRELIKKDEFLKIANRKKAIFVSKN